VNWNRRSFLASAATGWGWLGGKATGFFVEELRPDYVLATLGKGRLTMQYKPLGADPRGTYTAEWM